MLIAGAGGHAREVVGIFAELGKLDNLYFYNNVSAKAGELVYNKFPVICSDEDVINVFKNNPEFVLGLGNPDNRKLLADKLCSLGGKLSNIIAPSAKIGIFNVRLDQGLNIMTNAVITQDIIIGEGTLINTNVSIHHNCNIGAYCEISPGCTILGNVTIGDYCRIGAGAIVLPGLQIGNQVTIGSGSVVTKDLYDGLFVKGVPAK